MRGCTEVECSRNMRDRSIDDDTRHRGKGRLTFGTHAHFVLGVVLEEPLHTSAGKLSR